MYWIDESHFRKVTDIIATSTVDAIELLYFQICKDDW